MFSMFCWGGWFSGSNAPVSHKKMKKKIIKHLKGDIKGYRREIKEDKKLLSKLKGKKMVKK